VPRPFRCEMTEGVLQHQYQLGFRRAITTLSLLERSVPCDLVSVIIICTIGLVHVDISGFYGGREV